MIDVRDRRAGEKIVQLIFFRLHERRSFFIFFHSSRYTDVGLYGMIGGGHTFLPYDHYALLRFIGGGSTEASPYLNYEQLFTNHKPTN